MKRILLLIVALIMTSSGMAQKYQPTWESLAEHNEAPAWFQDAKLGIYFHWGVYSVPAFGDEWYPSRMFYEQNKEFKHHLEKYGHPSEFGYHDFVPMFKAEYFDPEEWADLFQKAGARFAGLVAEHHDGFSMWDSSITPWNSMDKGPRRDIAGELAAAFRKSNLKFITTFHHARNLQRFQRETDKNGNVVYLNSHYPFFEGMPTSSSDNELKYLYGNIPESQWLEEVWLGKLKEVIDRYHPDIIWFDSWLDQIPEEYQKEFCAYYLNDAEKLGKEVVIVRKQEDLPLEISVDDLEKSRKNRLEEKTWMTDETVSTGSWCYTEGLEIKPTEDILHVLIDIVSKNGVLLLNISPKADGTIPEDQRNVLLGIGQWLASYGEAIYGTRPWYDFGEGPTREPEGHYENHAEFLKIRYTTDDIRYTTSNGVIYASILGQPETGKEYLLKAFAADALPEELSIQRVSLLGSDVAVRWTEEEQGLRIKIPECRTDEMAVVIKIESK